MYNRPFSLVTYAGIFLLAVACSGDNPAGPGAPGQVNPNAPVSNAIKSDVAASAGNAIASDLEELVANQVAAIGTFAFAAPSASSFSDGTSAPAPAPEHHDSTPASEPQHPDSNPPAPAPEPEHHDSAAAPAPAPAPAPVASESCSFNSETLFYSCTKVSDSKKVVKSYQFLDGAGKAMEKFVRGVTDAIHFVVKADGSESGENFSGVSHSQRDVVESGFLGPNRVYSGAGSSADTSSHKQELVTRKYSGVSVDTLKAVTFVDQRNEHPYPLSGVAVRVVDYTVVSSGTQLETTTVHKRVVVTFNGTANVPISLGDYNCVLHLDTHKVDSCN